MELNDLHFKLPDLNVRQTKSVCYSGFAVVF